MSTPTTPSAEALAALLEQASNNILTGRTKIADANACIDASLILRKTAATAEPKEQAQAAEPLRVTPELREALRKDVMAEFNARMPITSKRFHEWRDWPGTWAFADAAVSVLVGHPKLAALSAPSQAQAGGVREALQAILKDPHGCAFCDSGKLRRSVADPSKLCEHDERCGFKLAQKALAGGDSKAMTAIRAVLDDLDTTLGEGSEIRDISPETIELLKSVVAMESGRG